MATLAREHMAVWKPCKLCHGYGWLRVIVGVSFTYVKCHDCYGTGLGKQSQAAE